MLKNTNLFKHAWVFLILAQTMVGLNIVASKFLVSTIPFLWVLVIRFTLAAVLLFPLHWCTDAKKTALRVHFSQLSGKDWAFLWAQSLCAGVFFNLLMLSGLQYTDANVAGIITSALPAIIALISWRLLGEKMSSKLAVCIALATLGLVVIALDKLNGMRGSHSFIGDVLILCALIPEALYVVLSKLHRNRLPVFIIAALLNAMSALVLLFLLPLTPIQGLAIVPHDWVILIILGLSSGLFYVCWSLGCQHVEGMLAALSTAVMPIATVILAWFFLGEQLTVAQCLGMLCVLFSILIYAKR